MSWIIKFVIAILLTSLTGSILFCVWYAVGKILEISGFINVMYQLLKVLLLFWYCPLAYFFLVYYNAKIWGRVLFHKTPALENISTAFLIIWIIGVIFLLVRYFLLNITLYRRYRNSVPVDGEVYEYFLKICKELGIKAYKVDLVYDYKTSVPCIGGFFHNYVVLPSTEYTRDQLKIIFMHELIHCKQSNHLLRHFTEIACMFHFFNPMVWILRRKVRYWGEYACDFEVIPKTEGVEYYFQVIQQIATQPVIGHILSPCLFENKDDIANRKALAGRSYQMKNKYRFLAPVAIIVMITISTCTVKAATEYVGNGYYRAYLATVVMVSEECEESDEVEYESAGFEPGVIVEKDGGELIAPLSITNLNWTISEKHVRESSDFIASSGQSIVMSAIANPLSSQIRIGIVEPDGTLRYVSGKGSALHTFTLTKSGSYSVYVQNMSDVSIEVQVTYSIE